MLCAHRALLRPRQGPCIRIENSILEISPSHRLSWIEDAYGNHVVIIQFLERADTLSIYSEMTVSQLETNPFDFTIDPDSVVYPFRYDRNSAIELAPLMMPVYSTDATRIDEWLELFWKPGQQIDTMQLLLNLNSHIAHNFRYMIRDEAGVQSPRETLDSKSGSCRDFATLFMEACRCLGLAARFVSGYVETKASPEFSGSVHAWAEVYLPGAGWKGFDPTEGLLVSSRHLPVAVARHPEYAMPVMGNFLGPTTAFLKMDVSLQVLEIM